MRDRSSPVFGEHSTLLKRLARCSRALSALRYRPSFCPVLETHLVWGKGREECRLIIVSEAAKRRFLEIKPAGSSNGEAMRLDTLRVSPNGKEPRVALYFGEVEVDDEPVEHLGEYLLYVSRSVSAAFDGCVVDLEETPEGVVFAIGPPSLTPAAALLPPEHEPKVAIPVGLALAWLGYGLWSERRAQAAEPVVAAEASSPAKPQPSTVAH
jgi:hypothetical protein